MRIPAFLAALLRSQESAWNALLNGRPRLALTTVLIVNTLLVLWTGQKTLRDFPNSGDEYAYLLSATLFAHGKLWVESPEPRESFALNHVVNDGRYYGKYPPGWPLLLSAGIVLGVPWLVNPLLSAVTLLVIYLIALELDGLRAANAALYVSLANPFFVLNSASYFSHSSCMAFLALASLLLLKGLREPESLGRGILLGLSAGIAFCIRPFTTVAFLFPLGLALAWRVRGPLPLLSRVKGPVGALGSFLICLGVYGAYNYLQTGSALMQPYAVYDRRDGLGVTPSSMGWSWGLRENLLNRAIEVNRWIPLSLIFVVAYFWRRRLARPLDAGGLLLLGCASLLLAYGAFLYPPGNQYGPRYVYEATFVLFLIMGCVLAWTRAAGILLLGSILFMNTALFATESKTHASHVRGRSELYECVRRAGLADAVVFLKTGSGSMEARDLTRNGISFFDREVLFVLDLGPQMNSQVLENYPGRKGYVYVFDAALGQGTLTLLKEGPTRSR